MANHHADGTVVGGIVGIHVKERRLQNGCGEANLIGGGIVVGVHHLRWHAPFFLVHRFIHLVEVATGLHIAGTLHILIEREGGIDVELAVVAPLVGIAHLHGEGIEFHQCVDLGAVAHPGERGDA